MVGGLDRPPRLKERKDNAHMFILDVDKTLTGDDDALKKFNAKFLAEQHARGSVLVYNTAISLKDYNYYMAGHDKKYGPSYGCLLRPDALIVGSGTQIWYPQPGENFILEKEWAAVLSEHWDAALVNAECAKLDDTKNLIEEEYWIEDVGCQKTIHAKTAVNAAEKLRNKLGPHYDVSDADSGWDDVRRVQVVPALAGKNNAAEYMCRLFEFPFEKCMWAGDSRGDSSMLRTQICGVLVGNASDELKADAKEAQAQNPDSVVRIYQATAERAGGVMEGMIHYKFDQ